MTNENPIPAILQELGELYDMTTPHQPMHRMRIAELFYRLKVALQDGHRLEDKRKTNCPGPPHQGHASSDWSCPLDRNN